MRLYDHYSPKSNTRLRFALFFVDFSALMNSAIVCDHQAKTKLSDMAKVLPQKLDVFFNSVYAKAQEIVPMVRDFCKTRNNDRDDCKAWTMEEKAPIIISESLAPREMYIVQLLCVLAAHLPVVRTEELAYGALIRRLLPYLSTD